MDDVPWFEPVEEESELLLPQEIMQITRETTAICERIIARLCGQYEPMNCFFELPAQSLAEIQAQNNMCAHRIFSMLHHTSFGVSLLELNRIQRRIDDQMICLKYNADRFAFESVVELADKIIDVVNAFEARARVTK